MWKQTRSRWFASQAGQASGPGCAPLNRDWVEAAADIAVTASGSRLARVRSEPARPGLLPHCDASRARPSKKRPSRYSRAYGRRQEQSENITLPATLSHPLHVITGLVPVITLLGGAALFRIGMAGTSPAMTCGWHEGRCHSRPEQSGGEGKPDRRAWSRYPSRPCGPGDDTQHVVGAGWPDDA